MFEKEVSLRGRKAVAIPWIMRGVLLELAGRSTGLPEGELPRRGKRGHPGVRLLRSLAMTWKIEKWRNTYE